MRLSALFEEFIRYLQVEREVTPHTVKGYRACFRRYTEFAGQTFTTEKCREFQYSLVQRELQSATVRLHLTVLSSFATWAVRRKRLGENPIDPLTRPKKRTRLPAVPKFDAVEEWLHNGLDLRTKALIALMAYGGLRCSEVVALNVGDYDPEFGLRRVRGKGGEENGVTLPDAARRIINEYLSKLRPSARSTEAMFVTNYITLGRRAVVARMTDHRVYRLVKALGRREGLPELHPHSFRHACGVELLNLSGGNLRAVQQHLRHADIQTTTIYARLAQPELKKIVGLFDRAPGQ